MVFYEKSITKIYIREFNVVVQIISIILFCFKKYIKENANLGYSVHYY